ncbi:MAG: hypothetical protein ACK56F_02590 [bacterium]
MLAAFHFGDLFRQRGSVGEGAARMHRVSDCAPCFTSGDAESTPGRAWLRSD